MSVLHFYIPRANAWHAEDNEPWLNKATYFPALSACCSLSAGAGGWRSQQALEGQSLCCPSQRLTLPRPGDPAPLLRCGKPSLILQAPPLGRLCREYTSSSTERQTVHHSANALRACDGSAAAVGAEDDADSAACLQEAQTRHKQKWK